MNAQEGMIGKCARCHRSMIIRKEGQRYGPRCARKMEQTNLEVKSTSGETLAVIV